MCSVNMDEPINKMNRVVVIIPAYNPNQKLLQLVDDLIKDQLTDIVIIDDGSTVTDSQRILELCEERQEIKVLRHTVNQGKGRAIKTGINYVLNDMQNAMGIITVDADGQHHINDVQKCILELRRLEMNADCIVLGCRNFKAEEVKIPLRSRMGNICTKWVLRYLCNIHVRDSQTGLRAIPYRLLPKLMSIQGEKYEYETNMLLELVDDGVILKEVEISTVYEDNNSSSHFNPIVDSHKIYSIIFKYSLASILSVVVDNFTFIVMKSICSNIWMMIFISRAVAAILNFCINKKLVFKKNGSARSQILRYIMLLLASGTLSAMILSIADAMLDINIIFLKLMIETLLYFLNFYVQKNFVFKTKKKNAN